jgi:SOS response regulatory protein OraA/RecX
VPGELAKALDELQAKDFINDGRAIESVVHRRSSKRWPPKACRARRWPRRWRG